MLKKLQCVCFLVMLVSSICDSQVLQFGTCSRVETMTYFDLERFLGVWYEISRFPTWYENFGACAYKTIQYCGRRIEIEHVFVKDGIQFVLHVNSTYYPGDDAVFTIQENNIGLYDINIKIVRNDVDPVGIPLTVVSTDYSNYALVYGCKSKDDVGLKYLSAWILSRNPTLPVDIYQKAVEELNAVPNANVAFLERVEQRKNNCNYHWTAHVQAISSNNTDTIED